MSGPIQQQREALGVRLRELRRTAGISGAELARRNQWHQTKVSKIEHGRIKPSRNDIRAWCEHCNALDQVPDLVASLENIKTAYLEWRNVLGTGTKRRQQALANLSEAAETIRIYNPFFIPGFLQTAEYAAGVLRNVASFYQTPDDVAAGVAKRLERQQLLYRGNRKFHFLIGEQALYTPVGNSAVMTGQLDRLLAVIGLPRVTIGIVPITAEIPFAPTNFSMFDTKMVLVEAITAEITATRPQEIKTYHRAFDTLAGQSVTGDAARRLIRKSIGARTE
ncbi:helix-turn-helix domain-containing protein [Nocardia blacklockiae]|uniref:helix-turn-helix domain-containing protein n=1 Tax=Nocardia blacklockiae TaxID=480036 RepID=UPI001894F7A7|nr:helix-turn-helix transcriptional regulator [Nocardia blacklockiae]MBF6176519.1 helix-turn-helix domain-containing protein [Nocardia blacklockiae]